MNTPNPGATDAPTNQPASADEANRPPATLPWMDAAQEMERCGSRSAAEEIIRLACEQWASVAHANWSKHLAEYRAHHLAETCRLQALLSERTAQLALCRDVLEDCRSFVKGRLLDSGGPHGDWVALDRIEAALADAPAADTGGKEAT